MSNVTHHARAQDFLYAHDERDEGGKVIVADMPSATAHATLAVGTAVRELTESLHQDRHKDTLRRAAPPPVMLSQFNDLDGDPFVLNVRALVAAVPDKDGVRIDTATASYWVAGTLHDVTAQVFQLVGSW